MVVLFVAGHPDLAGRFEKHQNWMRFVGAVHAGRPPGGSPAGR
jgi:hypothetical protein